MKKLFLILFTLFCVGGTVSASYSSDYDFILCIITGGTWDNGICENAGPAYACNHLWAISGELFTVETETGEIEIIFGDGGIGDCPKGIVTINSEIKWQYRTMGCYLILIDSLGNEYSFVQMYDGRLIFVAKPIIIFE